MNSVYELVSLEIVDKDGSVLAGPLLLLLSTEKKDEIV